MSGYDLSSQNSFRLMKGRLGIYDKKPFNPNENTIEGVFDQAIRLRQMGGNKQQERMIKDKRRSLDRAIWYSYQGAEVVKTDAEDQKPVQVLINPNKLKQDYDDKIISVGWEYEFAPGTVFKWLGTDSYWLIYLQDLTELAYFRGDIRKCNYQLSWKDEDGNIYSSYVAVRGPVETKINYLQKHGISVDTPNHSVNILMPKTEAALNYFKRYNKFYLNDNPICWRVEAVDSISTPGILEINGVEYYSNKDEDDIDNGIVGGLIEKIEIPEDTIIQGETFIKIKQPYTYIYKGRISETWTVDKKYPVTLKFDELDPRKVTLIWTANYSGQFDLFYGDCKKTIVVESLF